MIQIDNVYEKAKKLKLTAKRKQEIQLEMQKARDYPSWFDESGKIKPIELYKAELEVFKLKHGEVL